MTIDVRSEKRTGQLLAALAGVVGLGLAVGACSTSQRAPAGRSATAAASPNVILIIGDGMDDQQITIARNFLVGSEGRLTLDGMPFRGAVQVQAVSEEDPDRPVYVSDSANTATSMSTGIVTSPSRIATTPGEDLDAVTILELARDAGMATGIVTTASVTDATPAAFFAHVNQRYCQGPRNMQQYLRGLDIDVDCSADYKANGGRGSISEQIADAGIDVVLGGGTIHFDQPAEGGGPETVTEIAESNGIRVVRTRDELLGPDAPGPVLGLFSRDTMPVRWRGVDDARATPVERVDGEIVLPAPITCEPEPRFADMPTLEEMTRFALERLDDGRGFFLMVESASIDKQSHTRQPCGHIGELAQLDEAVALALDYAAAHPETLVLVTADHSHAAQIVTETGGFASSEYATPGYLALLPTREGGLMAVNYATNDSPTQEYHTGSQVPLYAGGAVPAALPTFVAQRELFGVMARHLGVGD